MDKNIKIFLELAKLFKDNGYSLYLVGGSVRDYLLGLPLTDMDVVTDAIPDEMCSFLNNADTTFKKYGSIKLVFNNTKFDITTLRKEKGYTDSRHPNNIVFTKSLEDDVVRRDISINAIYLDDSLNLIDLVNGQDDINNKVIRLIGDKEYRIVEDPLRILRIFRFSIDLDFRIEEETYYAIKRNVLLINKLNPEKIKQEINKCKHNDELNNLLKLMNININM